VLPGLAGGAQGAGLARPGRADQHRHPFAALTQPPHGVGLVTAQDGPGQHPVGGGDNHAGGVAGFDGVEDGLLGLQRPPGTVTRPAVADVESVGAGQLHHVGMSEDLVGGRLDHLPEAFAAARLVRREHH
jgi:hypothetical protein